MKRFAILVLTVVMIFNLCVPVSAAKVGVMRDLTSAELLDKIRIGWNLGNTFDAYSGDGNYTNGWIELYSDRSPSAYEKAWTGGVLVTPELIKAVKDMGFKAIRMPVTWGPHMDEEGNIDKAWLDRIEEVVNYILDEGLYCLINSHHDCGGKGWLAADAQEYPEISARFKTMWTQIAERFKDYSDYLMFEAYNEILDRQDNWGGTTPANFEAANKLNQDFVDVVRATGGNNAKRHLSVNVYACSSGSDSVLNSFKLPEDTIENRLFVQIHCYDPQRFCWTPSYIPNPTDQWVANRKEFTDGLNSTFAKIERIFIDKGIPVIIGEFSADNKNNTPEREAYATDFVTIAREHGISALFYWDVNFTEDHVDDDPPYAPCGLIDRGQVKWLYPTVAKALIEAAGVAHNYSGWTEYNADDHIRHCTDLNCDSFERQPHVWSNSFDSTCDLCNYVRFSPSGLPSLTINDKTAYRGSKVLLDVSLKSCGLADTVKLTYRYDPIFLTPDIQNSEWLVDNSVTATFGDGIATLTTEAPLNPNYTLAQLGFTVSENAPLGQTAIEFEASLSNGSTSVARIPASVTVTVSEILSGDTDGNCSVDKGDAIYLLYSVLFGESQYHLNQPCDFNGSGSVDKDDAIYLLYHVLFGSSIYPLS